MMEWLAMGGYGKYVWSSYAIWFVVILFNYVISSQQEKQYIRELTKRLTLKKQQ